MVYLENQLMSDRLLWCERKREVGKSARWKKKGEEKTVGVEVGLSRKGRGEFR